MGGFVFSTVGKLCVQWDKTTAMGKQWKWVCDEPCRV